MSPRRNRPANPRATQGRRRAYGQHFLKDRQIAEHIAREALERARAGRSIALLEIGPGRGAITEPLLAGLTSNRESSLKSFIICEKDRALARDLNRRQEEMQAAQIQCEIRVLEADFLELEHATWLSGTPLTVVSNLPYSSGTAIFTSLAAHPEKINAMVLMFQTEVAHRLRAERGTKDWGSLSIWTQNRWNVKKLLAVPPGAFIPPPQVQSEVVVLEPRPEPRIPETLKDEAKWNLLLKSSFQHRRKMLRAGLPKAGALRNALELSGVDDTKRAEALDWEEWGKLYRALLSSTGNVTSS